MKKVDTLTSEVDPAEFSKMFSGMNPMMNSMPMNENIIDAEAKEIEDVGKDASIKNYSENDLQVVTEDTPLPPAVTEDIHEEVEPYIVAKTVTPFNIAINEKSKKKIATIYFLCRDEDDKLFIIDRNLILESEEDALMIESLPFTEDLENDFVSNKILTRSLNAYLPAYIIDMKFYINDGFEKDSNPTLYTYGVNVNTKENIKIKMSADIFACMAFVDSYIFDGVDCEYDLALATVAGSKIIDPPAEFFLIDKIESIVSMANAVVNKKKGFFDFFKKKDLGTTVGIVLKLNRFISKDEKETVSLLTPFDVGVTFDESKYRGKTIEQIQDEYYGDSDQYVATLNITNIRLYGIDKEYMIIRGKNKDKKVKLFLFDASMKEELNHLINTY